MKRGKKATVTQINKNINIKKKRIKKIINFNLIIICVDLRFDIYIAIQWSHRFWNFSYQSISTTIRIVFKLTSPKLRTSNFGGNWFKQKLRKPGIAKDDRFRRMNRFSLLDKTLSIRNAQEWWIYSKIWLKSSTIQLQLWLSTDTVVGYVNTPHWHAMCIVMCFVMPYANITQRAITINCSMNNGLNVWITKIIKFFV